MGADGAVSWLTLPKAIEQADDLLSAANAEEHALLSELRHYLVEQTEAVAALIA